MRIGAVFPQTEIGADPIAVKDYAQAVEGLGLDHILTFDHVLGGNAATHDLKGPYKHTDSFHELFVLYGYLAGITEKIELTSGIIILPQRPQLGTGKGGLPESVDRREIEDVRESRHPLPASIENVPAGTNRYARPP